MERSACSLRGNARWRPHRRLQTVCNPSPPPPTRPPPQSHTTSQTRLRRPWGRTRVQTVTRRRGRRSRTSHDHAQTLDAQTYTSSESPTPPSAMQGRTLLIGTHFMCSAGVGDPPRKPRSVAENRKQTGREPMVCSVARHKCQRIASGIGAPPANSEQWWCGVEVA